MSSLPPPESSPIPATLADAWRRSRPTDLELARAYDRFQRRGAPYRRSRVGDIALWMSFGMLLGIGSLYAATSTYERWRGSPQRLHAPAPPDRAATSPALSEACSPPSSEPSAVDLPAAGGSSPVTAPSSMSEAPLQESWQRAARGLRESNFEAADEALLKLAHQGSPAERDAAKLVRAQVLLRQERRTEARQLLTELTANGVSPATKDRAAQLLNEMTLAASSHRSFGAVPGTDAP